MGLTSMQAYGRRAGGAVSAEAQAMTEAAAACVRVMEVSETLFGRKADVISQLLAMAAECRDAGWDGADARPLDSLAIHRTVEFLKALPDRVEMPEVAPSPDGNVVLDWIQTRRRMFSLRVGAGPQLAFALLAGTDKGHGVASFDGINVPLQVLTCIEMIQGSGNAGLRTL